MTPEYDVILESTWLGTKDGELLRSLFGYYPTLHDAVVLSVEYERASESLTMQVYYSDEIDIGPAGMQVAPHLSVLISLIWQGVESFEFDGSYPEIFAVNFSRKGRLLETQLVMCGASSHGRVMSETFEANLLQVDPPANDQEAIWFKIR